MDDIFEPFGGDYQAGTVAGASQNGIYPRLPDQWNDGTWNAASFGAERACRCDYPIDDS